MNCSLSSSQVGMGWPSCWPETSGGGSAGRGGGETAAAGGGADEISP
jgi:hypothetical protein